MSDTNPESHRMAPKCIKVLVERLSLELVFSHIHHLLRSSTEVLSVMAEEVPMDPTDCVNYSNQLGLLVLLVPN